MTLKAIFIKNFRFYALDSFEFLGMTQDGSDRPLILLSGDRHNRQSAICCQIGVFLSNLSGDGLHF
jgi:hypothetical protein